MKPISLFAASVLFLNFSSFNAAAVEAQPEPMMSPIEITVNTETGNLVYGIDVLGRWLFALDVDGDDYADWFGIYTWEERIQDGPWTARADNVQMIFRKDHDTTGALMTLRSLGDKPGLFIQLGTGAQQMPKMDSVAQVAYSFENGVELATRRIRSPATYPMNLRDMRKFDHSDLSTWPDTYEVDLLGPKTGPCLPIDPQCTQEITYVHCKVENTIIGVVDGLFAYAPCGDDGDAMNSCPSETQYCCAGCEWGFQPTYPFLVIVGFARCKMCLGSPE